MFFVRHKMVFLLAVLALLGFLVGAPAEQLKNGREMGTPKIDKEALQSAHEVVQQFPSNDTMQTAWKVHWATSTGYGLYIQDAWFKRDPKEPWQQILGDARLAEMFVPYHSGSPRFWDISYDFALCNVNKDDCGPYGKILDKASTVVHEVRDRGLMWADGTKGSRRGQKLVLFAILNAANYRYVIEYGFQDDGVISFRVGSTGRNYSSREFEGHMHHGLWRIDANIGGPENNSVVVMEHQEPVEPDKAMARTLHRPFHGGIEGFEDWDPIKFTMLSVQNNQIRNIRDQPMAYDFMMAKHGTGRHYGQEKDKGGIILEECMHHDFWVTKNRKGEIYYQKLPQYVKNAEPIMNSDVVVWVSTPGHHEPRSEDGELKGTAFTGVTPIMWCGFEMKPRNFWDRSPLYP